VNIIDLILIVITSILFISFLYRLHKLGTMLDKITEVYNDQQSTFNSNK